MTALTASESIKMSVSKIPTNRLFKKINESEDGKKMNVMSSVSVQSEHTQSKKAMI